MNAATTGSACFIADEEEDECLTDMEAGFSANLHNNADFLLRTTLRSTAPMKGGACSPVVSASSSPRWGGGERWFHDVRLEGHRHRHHDYPHFLYSCFLCNKRLSNHKDIFMYRGDNAFCSEECRQEQIEMDEARERKWNLSSSMKALRMKEQAPSSSSSSAQPQDQHFRTRPVVAV